MKKIYYFLLLITNFLCAQTPQVWQNLNPKPTSNYGKDLIFISDTKGFYITDQELVATTDAGETWSIKKEISYGVDLDFKNNKGLIVGNAGKAYLSNDSGDSWNLISINSTESFIYCKIISDNQMVVASSKNLYFSNNGGTTWVQKNITTYNARRVYFLDQNTGFLGSSDGKMYKTTDGGSTWIVKNSVNYSPSDYFTIYFYSNEIGFAVRGHGELLKTADGGENWTKINSPTDDIFSFHFLSENVGYATGEYGVIFKTVDGGLTWSNRFFQLGRTGGTDMFGIYFTSENTGHVVGARGRILKTIDGGSSWKEYAPFYNDANNINYVDNEIFVRVGLDVFNTIDDGLTWKKLTRPADFIPTNEWSYSNYSTGMTFVNNKVGYLIGGPYYGDAKIYKTIDGGITWIKKYDFYPMDGVSSIHFINENVGFVSGGFNNKSTYKTVDGGSTWSVVNNNNFRKIKFLNENIGYGVDNSFYDRKLYKTSDAGQTWNVLVGYEKEIKDFNFIDEQVGFLVGNSDLQLQKTTDGGITWKKYEAPYAWYDLVKFKNKNVGLIITEYGQIQETYDGGRNWKTNYNYYGSKDILLQNNDIYLVGVNGKVLKSSFKNVPNYVLTNNAVTNVTNNKATFNGSAASNSSQISNLMFEYSKLPSFSQSVQIPANKQLIDANDSDDLSADAINLEPATKYYVRLSGLLNGNKIFGNTLTFTSLPNYKIELQQIYDYYATTADLHGLVSATGNDLTNISFEYSENQNDFTSSEPSNPQIITIGTNNAYIVGKLQNLNQNTRYYVRIKAQYENNAVYSNVINFTTKKEYDIMLYEANVNENQVYLNSSVYANDKDITDIVFEYGSLEFNNTLNITPNYVNGQASNYLSSILQTNSLDANKAYKVRLKGFTNGKTVYSNTILFNSNKSLILIEDKTEVLSSTSIKLSGLIKSYDYYPVTDISFEYGTSPDLGTVIQAAPNYSYNLSTFPVSQIISELNLGQKYYYKISAVQNGIKKYSDLYEFIMNPLATTENFENNTILIYPNPVKNQLFLDAKTKITKIEVYDLTGKLIMKKLQENIKSINIEDLSVATYILKIYTKDKTISKKIIKQ